MSKAEAAVDGNRRARGALEAHEPSGGQAAGEVQTRDQFADQWMTHLEGARAARLPNETRQCKSQSQSQSKSKSNTAVTVQCVEGKHVTSC